MGRRGNCHDNTPVESFFGLLKRGRIRRRIYPTKDAARAEVFDYIEMFTTPNAAMVQQATYRLWSLTGAMRNEGPECLRKPGRINSTLSLKAQWTPRLFTSKAHVALESPEPKE